MRILWLQNECNQEMSALFESAFCNNVGWLEGMYNQVKDNEDIELGIVADIRRPVEGFIKKTLNNKIFYGYNEKDFFHYSEDVTKLFKEIIEDFKPDIVHIIGTEYAHSLSMVKAFNNPDKTIIQIQGMIGICGYHYLSGVDDKLKHKFTFRDICRRENLIIAKRKMEERGLIEKAAIEGVKNIIGRTQWDDACTRRINPEVTYYKVNESIRNEFYSDEKWDEEKIEKHSIFVSQGGYPIKGFHIFINAVDELISKYPDLKIYIAGSLAKRNNWRYTAYEKFLLDEINKKNRAGHIEVLGHLTASEVKERMLKSNVVVSSSVIENESNTISEARMLGVPVVASFVGGLTDRIKHGEDGFLYQVDAPYMLSYYVQKIFDDSELAKSLSKNEIETAKKINDKDSNRKALLDAYERINRG